MSWLYRSQVAPSVLVFILVLKQGPRTTCLDAYIWRITHASDKKILDEGNRQPVTITLDFPRVHFKLKLFRRFYV